MESARSSAKFESSSRSRKASDRERGEEEIDRTKPAQRGGRGAIRRPLSCEQRAAQKREKDDDCDLARRDCEERQQRCQENPGAPANRVLLNRSRVPRSAPEKPRPRFRQNTSPNQHCEEDHERNRDHAIHGKPRRIEQRVGESEPLRRAFDPAPQNQPSRGSAVQARFRKPAIVQGSSSGCGQCAVTAKSTAPASVI
jgi:hypothetical protein